MQHFTATRHQLSEAIACQDTNKAMHLLRDLFNTMAEVSEGNAPEAGCCGRTGQHHGPNAVLSEYLLTLPVAILGRGLLQRTLSQLSTTLHTG